MQDIFYQRVSYKRTHLSCVCIAFVSLKYVVCIVKVPIVTEEYQNILKAYFWNVLWQHQELFHINMYNQALSIKLQFYTKYSTHSLIVFLLSMYLFDLNKQAQIHATLEYSTRKLVHSAISLSNCLSLCHISLVIIQEPTRDNCIPILIRYISI